MNKTVRRALQHAGLWGPVLIQMGLIFYFSAQPAGSPALERFPFSGVIGHFGGYGLLALLLYRACAGSWRYWDGGAALRAGIIAVLYGIVDEFHQGFVPGRHPSALDVLVDTAGVLTALAAVRFWTAFRERLLGKRREETCAGGETAEES